MKTILQLSNIPIVVKAKLLTSITENIVKAVGGASVLRV